MKIVALVPSLKVSGGIREVIRLASDLKLGGVSPVVLSMWISPSEMGHNLSLSYLSKWTTRPILAMMQLPLIVSRFYRWRKNEGRDVDFFVFTHYATLPLALLIPQRKRLYFVQDLEWKFLGDGLASYILRFIILFFYRSGYVISTNSYLTQSLASNGVNVVLEAPIWAEEGFAVDGATERDIDFVMVLRKGRHKRLDLYLRFINLAQGSNLRVAIITPENSIIEKVSGIVDIVLFAPTHDQMRNLYSRSKCFVHLSEHEGFGLPPLEAMAAGCVPVCRDSGGVRSYMKAGPCGELLFSSSMSIDAIFARAQALIKEPQLGRLGVLCREHFKQGARKCLDERTGVVSVLRTLLR